MPEGQVEETGAKSKTAVFSVHLTCLQDVGAKGSGVGLQLAKVKVWEVAMGSG